jgi:hypothetical protein
MNVFKYMMHILRTRLILEWKDLTVTYPLWLTHVVMDELYYVTTLVVMSLACFAVGMITGTVWTMV